MPGGSFSLLNYSPVSGTAECFQHTDNYYRASLGLQYSIRPQISFGRAVRVGAGSGPDPEHELKLCSPHHHAEARRQAAAVKPLRAGGAICAGICLPSSDRGAAKFAGIALVVAACVMAIAGAWSVCAGSGLQAGRWRQGPCRGVGRSGILRRVRGRCRRQHFQAHDRPIVGAGNDERRPGCSVDGALPVG